MNKYSLLAIGISVAACSSVPAFSQVAADQADAGDSGVYGIQDIVVTAQKISSNLQDTPIAITALSGEDLSRRGLTDINSLGQAVPSLVFTMVGGQTELSLRGIGLDVPFLSGEGAVALNVDGVYIGRQFFGGATNADLERIEVLRGPQGTLYGRNATGGAVNMITRAADASPAYDGEITVGSFGRVSGKAAVGGPLSEATRIRVVAFGERQGNDAENVLDGDKIGKSHAYSFRGTLAHDFSSSLTSTVRGDYGSSRDTTPLFSLAAATPTFSPLSGQFGVTPYVPGGVFQPALGLSPSIPVPTNGNDYAFNKPTFLKLRFGGASLTNEWSPDGSPFGLKTITAYRVSKMDRAGDADGSTALIQSEDAAFEHADQFTQEINLSYALPHDGNVILGAFYYNEGIDYLYDYSVPATARVLDAAQGFPAGTVPPSLGFSGRQKTESFAVFGQADIPVTERLKLTGGLRYTKDKKSLDQTLYAFGADLCRGLDTKDSWESVTYKAGLDYKISDRVMTYVSVSSGFKGGGVNIGTCGNTFDPEKLTAYEAGMKGRFFDNAVQANLAVFRYDYKSIQANITIPTGSAIQNAASAKVQGAEAELSVYPTSRLRISGALSYVDSKYKDFALIDPTRDADPVTFLQPVIDVSGNPLIKSPRWSGNVTIAYSVPLSSRSSLTASYDGFFTSGYNFDVFANPNQRQPGFSEHDARLTWVQQPDGNGNSWEASLFVNNIGNKRHYISNFANTIVGGTVVAYSDRRSFGLTVRFKHK